MHHWQLLNEEDRRAILEITSGRRGLPLLAIEKDWWVTMTLKALSLTQYFALMSFKGGTSLSKGWGLINRFSEDIDIALSRKDVFAISSTSNNQLAKVRRKARHYIIRELPIELNDIMTQMGLSDFSIEPEIERFDADGNNEELRATTHPSTIFINYKSILTEKSEYILPRVKIEISCLSMDEPVEIKKIQSLMSEALGEEEDINVMFPTVVPSRTFLEKIFLLHEEFQKGKPRHKRMSRHLYDIEKIMDTPFGEAINDKELYCSIIEHRSIFNRIEGVDYALHAPTTLSFIPPANVIPDWEKDYISMQRNFIYDKNSLTFSRLLDRMSELTLRIRQLGDMVKK